MSSLLCRKDTSKTLEFQNNVTHVLMGKVTLFPGLGLRRLLLIYISTTRCQYFSHTEPGYKTAGLKVQEEDEDATGG